MKIERNILVIEEDLHAQNVYKEVLDIRYNVAYFNSFGSLQENLAQESFPIDLIITELLFKDGPVIPLLEQEWEKTLKGLNIMVISSIDDIDIMRYCFSKSIKDFLLKPIRRSELIVKVEKILNGDTYPIPLIQDIFQFNDLTATEIKILQVFNTAQKDLSREEIVKLVWGNIQVHYKTLDVHLHNLRKKLVKHNLEVKLKNNGHYCLITKFSK